MTSPDNTTPAAEADTPGKQQDHRIEIRFDYFGDEADARHIAAVAEAAITEAIENANNIETTAIFDEDWNEI